MPAKLSFICMIHSLTERDSSNYVIRDATAVRKEDNTKMDVKIISFVPKNSSVPRWIPLFDPENVIRLTGKFILEEQPPHSATLQVKK